MEVEDYPKNPGDYAKAIPNIIKMYQAGISMRWPNNSDRYFHCPLLRDSVSTDFFPKKVMKPIIRLGSIEMINNNIYSEGAIC